MGKKNKKGKGSGKSKSPARQRPTASPTGAAATTTTTTTTPTSRPAPASIPRPTPVQVPVLEVKEAPKQAPEESNSKQRTPAPATASSIATAASTVPPASLAPTEATEEAPFATAAMQASNNTTSRSNDYVPFDMGDATVTFEHLDIIHKYGGEGVDKSTAVVDMHTQLKSAAGHLASLNSSNYAFRFNPLKEAIWFSKKGQFVPQCQQQDWTLCKAYMTVKTSASSLTTNLAFLDLEWPDDTSVQSLKTIGNKLEDDMSNAWFHLTLEALYDLVELDSNSSVDLGRRKELLKRVASFVFKGSKDVLETSKPKPARFSKSPSAPPRCAFGQILQVYLKLKELGARTDVAQLDWTSMGIPPEDGAALWMSLRERAQLNLPQAVWWKVLFVLVLEFEPHLLRMNVTLLDSPTVTTFQDFLDECMEPPDQVKGKFYKKMIQQVFSLQNVCLLTDPSTRANTGVLDVLTSVFASGEDTVYDKHVVADVAAAAAPVEAQVEYPAPTPAPAPAPVDPPAPVPEPSHAGAPEVTSAVRAPSPTPAVDAPGPNLAPSAKRASKTAPTSDAIAPESENTAASKPPMPTIRTVAKPNSGGRPPRNRSPTRSVPPKDIPFEIDADNTVPGRYASDNYSLAGSLGVELNKEEDLMHLMHQAAAMCDVITTEKRDLVTKERRMGRNLKSAQDNLTAVQVINSKLMSENKEQKEEIYQREDDVNQLHDEAKHAARELSSLDALNSQLQEQIEALSKTVESLTTDKTGLEEELSTSKAESASLEDALEVSRKENEVLKADIASEQASKNAVEHDLTKMQQEKDAVELTLKDTQGLLDSANDEIDRLEEIQAEQQGVEAEARKAAMEARRREFEMAEREAEESQKKAEDMRAAKAAARKTRMVR